MDEKLIAIIAGVFIALTSIGVYSIKWMLKKLDKKDETIEKLGERSIVAIEKTTVAVENNNEVLIEIKRLLTRKK